MSFLKMARLSSIGKTVSDGVDYTSDVFRLVPVLVEVVAHAAVVGVFVCLDLLLFFCLLHGSYAALLDVLRVLVLLGGCLVF